MKRSWILVMLAVLVSLLSAGPALAWDEAKFKAEVQGLLDQAAAGFEKGDLKAVLATSAPDAVIKYKDGRTLEMAKWEAEAAKDVAGWKDDKSTFKIEKVWPKGPDKGGAVYSERHEFTRADDPGHQQVINARFRVLLTKTPEGWRFLEFQELGTTITRDGKACAAPPQAK